MKQEQFVAKECIVSTLQGKLRGYTVGGVSAFLGVPYAKANRFHPPQSPDGWEGVRDALSYGYACPTPAKGRPSDETLMPLRFWPTDEHCQYLNVWTPNVEGKRPVMFWIHGGAYAAGSSMEHMYYDPRNLCAQGDVVVVSVNHRLNILGYLDLSPFGSEYENSANAGNADLVAALRWVRDNIAAFGGDPECVTLFGQSGGGMKISDIMQTPAADHLYHRAVIQSGILPMLLPPRKGDGTSIVTAMMRELGLENVGQLEEIPYEILLEGYQRTAPALAKEGWYTGGVPMANSWFQGDPLEHGFTEYSKTVPTMVGTTFGEFTYTLADPKKYKKTEQELLYGLREKFGNATEQAVERFRAVWPGRNINDLMAEDAMCRLAAIQYIQEKARVSSAPVYSYLFAYESPFGGGVPAWHCMEIPFVFRNTHYVARCMEGQVTEKLEDQVSKAWVSFAKDGSPQHEGLPLWKPCTPQTETTMVFDRVCQARENFDHALLAYIQQVAPQSFPAMG